MTALHARGFPTPRPIDHSRHVIVMSRIEGSFPMAQVKTGRMEGAGAIFAQCMSILKRLAEHGLVHCDFNEFNLLVNGETAEITLIDFPQIVSTSHLNAAELFARDVKCLIKFFSMKMQYTPQDHEILLLEDIVKNSDGDAIDREVRASGYDPDADDSALEHYREDALAEDDEEEDDEDDDDNEKEEEEGLQCASKARNGEAHEGGTDVAEREEQEHDAPSASAIDEDDHDDDNYDKDEEEEDDCIDEEEEEARQRRPRGRGRGRKPSAAHSSAPSKTTLSPEEIQELVRR